MKQTTLLISLFILFVQCSDEQRQELLLQHYYAFFQDVKIATMEHKNLWDKDLYGPILLVDPQTRKVYSNMSDSEGVLKRSGSIYEGILPIHINISDTEIYWNGRIWAMLTLPLDLFKKERIDLAAHELFHSNYHLFNDIPPDFANYHLIEKEARIYMRLELSALNKTLNSKSEKDLHHHLTNALIFRKYRHSLYPNSDFSENMLELGEGLAQYTGLIISGRNKNQMKKCLINRNNYCSRSSSFVRTFAYYTIPSYGFLLYNKDKKWNKKITEKSDLTEYIIRTFNIEFPTNLKGTVERISNEYGGEKIIRQELKKENLMIVSYENIKHTYIEEPHFEIYFERMNFGRDMEGIFPFVNIGTFYNKIRITDYWGILTVESGALICLNWRKVALTMPLRKDGNLISGNGWTLKLEDGYSIEMDEFSGNIFLDKEDKNHIPFILNVLPIIDHDEIEKLKGIDFYTIISITVLLDSSKVIINTDSLELILKMR